MHLDFDRLAVSFSMPDGEVRQALGSISFDIPDGQFVAILGPSGCGKSTLVRVVAGLQTATDGAVIGDDSVIDKPRDEIALMFQDATLMPWRTVQDNIALPLELKGVDKKERYKIVQHLLPNLGLVDYAQSYPAALSGGMAQRVALGRVLVQRPEVLLLDEPFGALDAMTRERISLDLLAFWRETQQTVMMVTHDINEAVLLADRVIILTQRPGRLLEDIEITLERPRTVEMIYTQTFIDLARKVREAIDRA